MKKTTLFLLLFLFINSYAYAYQKLIYKGKKGFIAKLYTVYEVKDVVYQGNPVKEIYSYGKVKLFGSTKLKFRYKSLNYEDENAYRPILNIQHDEKKGKIRSRAQKFDKDYSFLYLHDDSMPFELREIFDDTPGARRVDIKSFHPEFDAEEHVIFDFSSLILSIKFLNLTTDNNTYTAYVATKSKVRKVIIKLIRDLPKNMQEISVNIIGSSSYNPDKIILDNNLNVVREIHGNAPVVGSYKIVLDLKNSEI